MLVESRQTEKKKIQASRKKKNGHMKMAVLVICTDVLAWPVFSDWHLACEPLASPLVSFRFVVPQSANSTAIEERGRLFLEVSMR